MRLDKYLADMGLGSRSDIKKNIRAGKALVNGARTKDPGLSVTQDMDISYMGQSVNYENFSYYMLHKPAGVISASEDKHQQTVIDLIEDAQKRKDLFPVGRLDKDTEGLLLITNDGQLAHRLLSPKHHVNKLYYARIAGLVTPEDVQKFRDGLYIDEELTCLPAELEILSCHPAEPQLSAAGINAGKDMLAEGIAAGKDMLTDGIADVKKEEASVKKATTAGNINPGTMPSVISEIRVVIQEGKFHQIKRMFQAVGKEVIYLKRLSMGPLQLDPALAPGEYRRLTAEELAALQNPKA